MLKRIQPRHIGMIAIGAALIAATIYMLMINVTLAHIEEVSGYTPFDMRPLGYGPTEAATLLEALGVDGRAYYFSRQIPLDTLYPAMLALTMIATILWFGQRMPESKIVRLGVALSVGSALCDYIENLGIIALIWSWPDVSVPLVNAASTATIAKSALTTLAVLLTLFTGFFWMRLSKSGPSPKWSLDVAKKE